MSKTRFSWNSFPWWQWFGVESESEWKLKEADVLAGDEVGVGVVYSSSCHSRMRGLFVYDESYFPPFRKDRQTLLALFWCVVLTNMTINKWTNLEGTDVAHKCDEDKKRIRSQCSSANKKKLSLKYHSWHVETKTLPRLTLDTNLRAREQVTTQSVPGHSLTQAYGSLEIVRRLSLSAIPERPFIRLRLAKRG